MAFVTRVLLFFFFQTGAVDAAASMLDSQEVLSSASAIAEERMLNRETFAAESFSHSKADAAASIQRFRAAQKDSGQALTESERRKIMQIKHRELMKKYGTPTAAVEESRPLSFSPGWNQPASFYMPEKNPDRSLHKHANHVPGMRSFSQIYAKEKAKTEGLYDLNHQQMETRVHAHQQPRKEITKQQKQLGLLRKKARPIVQDNKWKRKMRDSHASKRVGMEHRMMRRLAFNKFVR